MVALPRALPRTPTTTRANPLPPRPTAARRTRAAWVIESRPSSTRIRWTAHNASVTQTHSNIITHRYHLPTHAPPPPSTGKCKRNERILLSLLACHDLLLCLIPLALISPLMRSIVVLHCLMVSNTAPSDPHFHCSISFGAFVSSCGTDVDDKKK